MVADRRAGLAGVAAAGRAELPAGDAATGRARWPALAPSRGAASPVGAGSRKLRGGARSSCRGHGAASPGDGPSGAASPDDGSRLSSLPGEISFPCGLPSVRFFIEDVEDPVANGPPSVASEKNLPAQYHQAEKNPWISYT
ncbi:uncharacterized protein [Miscanthus floridulus]|uniref:uncharacterized protein n=1 Tax=Miscanthus floridulus TaxID=154761 RepID=UPI0034592B77